MAQEEKIYHLIKTGPRAAMMKAVVGGGRVLVDTYDDYTIPLKYTFTDKDDHSKTIRFLRASDEIDQAIQIKNGFAANMKLTSADRRELKFKNGILKTTKKNVIKYLDACPANESFDGDRGEIVVLFKEYVPQVAIRVNLDLGKRTALAVLAMHDMDDVALDIKLLKIFGSAYSLPKTIDEKREAIQDAINDVPTALDIILDNNTRDTVETIIGKAINAGIISLLEREDQIMIKRNDIFENFMMVGAQNSEEQKQSLMLDRLSSSEGKLMLQSLQETLRAKGIQVNTAIHTQDSKTTTDSTPVEQPIVNELKDVVPPVLTDETMLKEMNERLGLKFSSIDEMKAAFAKKEEVRDDKKSDDKKTESKESETVKDRIKPNAGDKANSGNDKKDS